MARASIDAHALYNPPSPALTNPDLILPFDGGVLDIAASPPRKPPSPPDSDHLSGSRVHGLSHGLSYSMPLRPSSSRSGLVNTLSSIKEVEMDMTPDRATYAHAPYATDTISSSPTLRDPPLPRLKPSWEPKNMNERRWSNGSGSVHSDDIENMHWPDFEGPSEVDEESVVLDEEEEQLGGLPKIADNEDPSSDEQYLSSHVDSLEDDPLSRRADLILANAKKRLQAMEGNLRGARNSLLISAPSSPSSTYYSQSGDLRERPRYPTASGIYGQKSRPYTSNFGHNRMISDSSSIHEIQTAQTLRIPKRASSALGSFARGLSTLEKSTSLRGVRSQQDMRDSRLQSWIEESSLPDETPRPASQQADRVHSRSPSMESFKRPGSAASSLRYQMDELKGRINTLKLKAHEDRAKRLSVSGSRTPSPFVAAPQQSRDFSNGSNERHSPPAKSNGSPTTEETRSHSRNTLGRQTPSKYAESTYEDAEEALGHITEEHEDDESSSAPSTAILGDEQKVLMGPQDPTNDELGYNNDNNNSEEYSSAAEDYSDPDRSHSPDTISLDGQSEYFDSVPVLAERHEDRADAFDYENFFLHSAMGSYTRERRDSYSSDDSVETTRPASPNRPSPMSERGGIEASSPPAKVKTGVGLIVDAPVGGLHRRSQSVESISTVATFETATEGDGADNEEDLEEEDPLDIATRQFISPSYTSTSTSTQQQPHSQPSYFPTHTTLPSNNTTHHDPIPALVTTLFASSSNNNPTTAAAAAIPAKDIQLVQDLLCSLRTVVAGMQAQAGDYERRAWRRRIDSAREALEAEG